MFGIKALSVLWFAAVLAAAVPSASALLAGTTLICNGMNVPPTTDCATPGNLCEWYYTGNSCLDGYEQDPYQNTWGPCQKGLATQYCFNAAQNSACYNVWTCWWDASNIPECQELYMDGTVGNRPVQLYACKTGS